MSLTVVHCLRSKAAKYYCVLCTSSLLLNAQVLKTPPQPSFALSLLPLVRHEIICFSGAVRALYYLTLKTYGNEKFAILTALTFSFNPASIFFSANYTESLYAFCGMYTSAQ